MLSFHERSGLSNPSAEPRLGKSWKNRLSPLPFSSFSSLSPHCYPVHIQFSIMALHLTQSKRLQIVIFISLSFFITEISSTGAKYPLLTIVCWLLLNSWVLHEFSCPCRRRLPLCTISPFPFLLRTGGGWQVLVEWSHWICCCICRFEGSKSSFHPLVLASNRNKISAKKDSPQDLSFGWQRARLLGAFFNGVFLLALGVSIFLQSIERFVSVQGMWHPVYQHCSC